MAGYLQMNGMSENRKLFENICKETQRKTKTSLGCGQ